MPASISSRPLRTRASKSGLRSAVQGVIRAGMVPVKMLLVIVVTPRAIHFFGKSRGQMPQANGSCSSISRVLSAVM
ncbi:hypothetical protein D3C77_697260 [compost metagenome]